MLEDRAAEHQVREIMRHRKAELLRTLIVAAGVESTAAGVRGSKPKWRATADEDGHHSLAIPL
jgi:hypothetical protein